MSGHREARIIITKDGDGYALDDAYYEDAVGALVIGVMGGCGCGDPSAALKMAADVASADWSAREKLFSAAGVDIDTNAGAGLAFGFMYWLDHAGLLEHCFGIMGAWLTPRGEDFVRLAREALAGDGE